jgi:hypothetical protein
VVTKSKFTSTKLKNLDMNADTYKLRRQVIELIYEANKLVRLPRVDVRITERDTEGKGVGGGEVLGQARMKSNIIWISKESVRSRGLRAVVFHELLHAVYGVPHTESSPLMSPHYVAMDTDAIHEEFIYFANKYKNK